MKVKGTGGFIEWVVGDKAPAVGDTCALALLPQSPSDITQSNPALYYWQITFYAVTREGIEFNVGSVHVPHFSLHAGAVIRIVACAYCPGAVQWKAFAKGYATLNGIINVVPTMECEVYLSASSESSEAADRAFCWTVNGDGIDEPNEPEDYPLAKGPSNSGDGGIYGNGFSVAQPLWAMRAWGSCETASGRTYLMLFDAPTSPPNGAQPLDVIALSQAESWFREWRQRFYFGLWLVPSSTPNTLTHDATVRTLTTLRQRQRRIV